MIALTVTPAEGLIDVPRRIAITGLAPQALVRLRTRTKRGAGVVWTSQAVYRADVHGSVDLTRDAPLPTVPGEAPTAAAPLGTGHAHGAEAARASSYEAVSPMGLIWSQVPEQAGKREVFPDSVTEAIVTEIDTGPINADAPLATAKLTQRLMGDGVRRIEFREDGAVGTLFTPSTAGPHPAILVLNGSGGGVNEARGALYASRGYVALALGYFKTPGLSNYISNTPLEYFRRALDWMAAHLQPKGEMIAVSGQSRGGELALLLGATYPDRVKAVIGYLPAAVVHSAQNAADPAIGRDGPAWLLEGKPLPHLWENNRTASWKPFDDGPAPHRHERAIRTALRDDAAVQRARIRVERIAGPVMLLSATDDGSWPSSDYSRMVVDRLAQENHPYPVQHLDFVDAGHAIVFPYVPTTQLVYAHPVSGRISTGGGHPAANARADEASWQGVLAFLNTMTASSQSKDV